jgi:hypothetical protein
MARKSIALHAGVTLVPVKEIAERGGEARVEGGRRQKMVGMGRRVIVAGDGRPAA